MKHGEVTRQLSHKILKMFTPHFVSLLLLFAAINLQAEAQNQEVLERPSNYGLGVDAYQEGDYRRAFNAWSLGAYEGDSEAQYNLGVLYLEGRGVEHNVEQAHSWFLKAAEKDHVEAQYNLGHMSLSGMGVEKNVEAALMWWKLAAEGGYGQAQFNYGRALYLGVEGYDDKQGGLLLIRQAAEQKDKRAVNFLEKNKVEISLLNFTENETAIVQDHADVVEPEPEERSAPVSLPASEPGDVKLHIVRDKQPVQANYFMRSANVPVIIYTGADFRSVMGKLLPGTLLKVTAIDEGKIQVIPAVGFPDQASGWIAARNLAYSGETMQQLSNAWRAHKQATNEVEIELLVPDVLINASIEPEIMPEPVKVAVSTKTDDVELQAEVAPSEITPGAGDAPGDLSSTLINDNRWLFTQTKGAYVIHLFTLLDFDKALTISRDLPYRDRAHLYTTSSNQQQWAFLLLGPYASETAAINAREVLPGYLAKGARIRLVSLIANNRCAKREQLDAQQSEGLDAYCF